MTLRLPDRWIWDSWYVWDGDYCHAFYLCASRGLYDPIRRHRNTNIGHAVSKDLINWEILPDAISPSESPAWDSWTTWTGSVVKDDDGKWWMFYTGTSRETKGEVQTIGAAVSDDLVTWRKHDSNPLVVADSRWYEKLADKTWHDEAWRDPWVYKSDSDGLWHMLITARGRAGKDRYRGVLGHAISSDLETWEPLKPLAVSEGEFAHLEVFQFAEVDGVPLLLFCCGWRELNEERLGQMGQLDATYSVVCNSGLENIDFSEAKPFLDNPVYAGRLVQDRSGKWFLLGFVNEVDGQFIGEISDPIPVTATNSDGLQIRL